MKRGIKLISTLLSFCLILLLASCTKSNKISYANKNNWAYFENEESTKAADVFLFVLRFLAVLKISSIWL